MIAITRDISARIVDCELTHLDREPIDLERARAQHREYRDALASLGCDVIELAADDAYPDCVFVEDTAIVLDDVAVITRPGAESRRGETRAIADALAPHRELAFIEAPATIDGGDVLRLGNQLFVGRSARTNDAALAQLARYCEVIPVAIDGCLHLKSAITQIAPDALLVNRAWVDVAPFAGWKLIDVDPAEPFAANALRINDALIYPAAFPRTRQRLGGDVRLVDASELAKAEGGVTCCSLLV
ncbi:MAG TPA: arginine deiminase-related protein [Thermoanaerobaculia bacterium]|nr:arginine deiminase-related protein [Thermoanaerobaculia bacterium]